MVGDWEKSLVYDPGSELQQGGGGRNKLDVMNGMKKNKKKNLSKSDLEVI